VLVTYVDRCSSCACSSMRDDSGSRPVPGVVGCGRACRCHATQHAVRAVVAAHAADAARFRFWRRARTPEGAVAATP
jgi:hypothetical protein